MQTKKSLVLESENLQSLEGLTKTYEDIALGQIQKIRVAVLKNRAFLAGVEEIYERAKGAYLADVLLITNKKERQKEIDFLHKNQKTAIVFISGNHSLLGSIIFKTYKVFLELINKVECDKIILGNIGRYLASGERSQFKFSYFPLDDFVLKEQEAGPVVELLSKFEKVFVVYPQFQSVLVQAPQVDEISGGITVEQSTAGKKAYFFEPSAKEVMTYFDSQIVGTLFRQKVLESMLAKHSSRLSIMDQGSQMIEKYVKKIDTLEKIASKRESNKELLNSFSGISLWTKQ